MYSIVHAAVVVRLGRSAQSACVSEHTEPTRENCAANVIIIPTILYYNARGGVRHTYRVAVRKTDTILLCARSDVRVYDITHYYNMYRRTILGVTLGFLITFFLN